MYGEKDDIRHLQINAPNQPGNSGGPVIDAQNGGGIVLATLDEAKAQNVNYAIKNDIIKQFLSKHTEIYNNIQVVYDPLPSQSLVVDDIVASTVQVLAC